MTPKASVIVPCWNAGEWVEDAVRSVLLGSFADFELIAVDDGSTDGTWAAVDRLAREDPRVRAVHQENRGLSGARNRGLDEARGEYVFFLDADDTFEADFIALGVEKMDATGADACICAWNIRDRPGAPVRTGELKGDYNIEGAGRIRAECLPRIIGYSMADVRAWYAGRPLFLAREHASVCRCVYRRETIERHRLRFNEAVTLYEDAVFNAEFLLHARRIGSIAKPVYNYTVHEGGLVDGRRRDPGVFRNKLTLLRERQRLNVMSGGALGGMYAASCVFSLLEMLTMPRDMNIDRREGRRIIGEYAGDPEVRAAVGEFPLSPRRPLTALAVLALRTFGAQFLYDVCRALFTPWRIIREGRLNRRRSRESRPK